MRSHFRLTVGDLGTRLDVYLKEEALLYSKREGSGYLEREGGVYSKIYGIRMGNKD